MRRIVGYNLEARLNENNTVTMLEVPSLEEIVVIEKPVKRILQQFETKTNYRAAQHSDSKMANILECLVDVFELQDYL